MIKLRDLLFFILSTANVCIFEYYYSDDSFEDVELYDGPAALVPRALYECTIKCCYALDDVLYIAVLEEK